ncbi:Uncharacterized protein QTN25_003924 [Entamoeba marina]
MQFVDPTPIEKPEQLKIIKKAATSIAATYPGEDKVIKALNDTIDEIWKKFIIKSYINATKPEKDYFKIMSKQLNNSIPWHRRINPFIQRRFKSILMDLKYDMIGLRQYFHNLSKQLPVLGKKFAKFQEKGTKITQLNTPRKIAAFADIAITHYNLFRNETIDFYNKIDRLTSLKKDVHIKFNNARLAANILRKDMEKTFFEDKFVPGNVGRNLLSEVKSILQSSYDSLDGYEAINTFTKEECKQIKQRVIEHTKKYVPLLKQRLAICFTEDYNTKVQEMLGHFTRVNVSSPAYIAKKQLQEQQCGLSYYRNKRYDLLTDLQWAKKEKKQLRLKR